MRNRSIGIVLTMQPISYKQYTNQTTPCDCRRSNLSPSAEPTKSKPKTTRAIDTLMPIISRLSRIIPSPSDTLLLATRAHGRRFLRSNGQSSRDVVFDEMPYEWNCEFAIPVVVGEFC